jgi:molecular chaperone DnaJ
MDLYHVLGVPRNASAGDIERSYTRLARRYHPGINPGDGVAAELYRRVLDAYAVLGDPDRRREYDRGAAPPPAPAVEATIAFQGFDFTATAEGASAATFSELFADVFQDAARRAIAPPQGAPIDLRLTLDFVDAIRGGAFPLSVTRSERCGHCGGSGQVPRAAAPCPDCGGAGSRRWARGHMVFTKSCETCGGAGQVVSTSCRVCGATGVHARSELVTLYLPPGVEHGARIAVPGRGHAGARGGPAGDLYVTIDVAPHPFFRRDGRDVRLSLPVAVHEAALGAKVVVPTLDGDVTVRVPAGSTSGQTLRVRGAGVPGDANQPPGDLLVELQIVLPPVRDERSRELLREFGRLNDVDVRRHLFGGVTRGAERAVRE